MKMNYESPLKMIWKLSQIHPGCLLTSEESATRLLQYAICNKLTGAALLDLLTLIKVNLPKVSTSQVSYVNQLSSLIAKCSNIPMAITNYCNHCLAEVTENNVCSTCK